MSKRVYNSKTGSVTEIFTFKIHAEPRERLCATRYGLRAFKNATALKLYSRQAFSRINKRP